MSSDNAKLLKPYLHPYQITSKELFKEIALGVIRWVNEGASTEKRRGFSTRQDADFSLEEDGDYWTWTVEEALPPEEAKVLYLSYNIYPRGEMRGNPKKNVFLYLLYLLALPSRRTSTFPSSRSLL